MSDPDPHDDTADDYERFEKGLLAQDGDARSRSTADLGEETAQAVVSDLLDAGEVTPVIDQRVLVHEPSGEAFESILQLAVFHRGWTTAEDASEAES